MRKLAIVAALVAVMGCKKGPDPMSVAIGTPKADVVAKYGPGLNTGNGFDGRTGTKWERSSYRSGNAGIGVEFTNDKVSKVDERPNHVPEWTSKVKVGMSMEDVFNKLGTPVSGYSPQDHRPDQFWSYGDPVAPIQTLTVYFVGGKVSKITTADNMALP